LFHVAAGVLLEQFYAKLYHIEWHTVGSDIHYDAVDVTTEHNYYIVTTDLLLIAVYYTSVTRQLLSTHEQSEKWYMYYFDLN